MKRKRRNHSASFKVKVAVAATRADKTLAELSEQFDVHHTITEPICCSQSVMWDLLSDKIGWAFAHLNDMKVIGENAHESFISKYSADSNLQQIIAIYTQVSKAIKA